MEFQEYHRCPDPEEGAPQVHRALPPALVDALNDQPFACVTASTDRGTGFVLKAPRAEIARVRGSVPIELRHELYSHPRAPVIRLLLRIYDQPEQHLAFESFINVRDPEQLGDYQRLSEQTEIALLFYDEQLE